MDLETIPLASPPALGFEMEDGRTVIVQPATRARLRAARACESDGEEARSHALAALVGPRVVVIECDGREHEADSAPILGGLNPALEMAWIAVIEGQAAGIDPVVAASLQRVLLLNFFVANAARAQAGEAASNG